MPRRAARAGRRNGDHLARAPRRMGGRQRRARGPGRDGSRDRRRRRGARRDAWRSGRWPASWARFSPRAPTARGRRPSTCARTRCSCEHLRRAPVAAVVSEEAPEVVPLRAGGGPVAVALDPLDGSGNIDSNAPMGTVFSLLPSDRADDSALAFRSPGDRQLAAGFVLYGPHTALVLTLGARRRGLHAGAARPGVPPGPFRRAHPGSAAGIRDQRVQRPPLAAAGPRLRRGVRGRRRWSARGRLQHALARLRGRGGLPHPAARRHLPLPGRHAPRLRARAGCACSTRRTRSRCWSSRRAARRRTASPASSTSRRLASTSACRSIFGSRDKVERVVELHMAGVPQAGQRPLFGARGLFRS